jgi:glucose-1-phosphate adenylyltransferase
MAQTLAMVLAGGRGKRMDILCQVRPKPALPFAGRFRVIDFSLSNCIHSQIRDIVVLTDYQRSHMAKYLRNWLQNNPGFSEFRILEPQAGSYKGTADAVYQNLDYLRKANAATVLILAGDHVYKMDYRRMLAFHEQVKADVTVGVIPVPIEEAYRFGIVTIDPEGRVVDFVEKPRYPQSNLVSMGIYVFNKRILSKRLSDDAVLPDSPHDFGYAILPDMVRRGDRVFAYKFNDYWRDIGTAAAYYEANMEIMSQQARFSLDGRWPVLTSERDSPSPGDHDTGNVVNSIVNPSCVVRGRVENSILSADVCIEDEAVVKNSVLMSNVSVGYHSVVDRCILDEQVNIGKFCYIGFGANILSGEWETTILGKAVVVPPYTAIGHNCKVLPHVGPSDFTTSAVPSGSIVSRRPVQDKHFVPEGVGVKDA